MKWIDAIIKVLQDADEPLHYTDITDRIIENEYRKSGELGATPQSSVSAYLTQNKKMFEKVASGIYKITDLAKKKDVSSLDTSVEDKSEDEKVAKVIIKENKAKIIKSFGMYWDREKVNWRNPELLGVQKTGATPVNFNKIRGIYLLHDGREVIYVGQALGSPKGIVNRLKDHTADDKAGRWDRFSWFGFDGVQSDGILDMSPQKIDLDIIDVANAFEGILIEGIEPRKNKRDGNCFGDEYLQYANEELELKKAQDLINDHLARR